MPFDAVLVDAGGVLIAPDPVRVASTLERFGVSLDPERAGRAHYAGVAALTRVVEGDRDAFMPYHRAFVTDCEVPGARLDDAANALADEFLRESIFTFVLPGATEALLALNQQGIAIAIVSNARGDAEDVLRRVGICQVGPGPLPPVAAVIDSAIVGFEKPDPRIFEHALTQLAVRPEAALHIGDTPAADVAGALAAGVTPVLVDPHDHHSQMGCRRVHSFTEVPQLVADLNGPG